MKFNQQYMCYMVFPGSGIQQQGVTVDAVIREVQSAIQAAASPLNIPGIDIIAEKGSILLGEVPFLIKRDGIITLLKS